VHRVDVANDALTSVVAIKLQKDAARFGSLAWGLDNVLAGGMTDGTVRLWNADSLEQVGQIQDKHTKGSVVRACQFNPHLDSKHLLATGGADKHVFVTDLSHGLSNPTTTVPADSPSHSVEVTSVAWNSETSLILASSSADGTVMVWDLRARKPFCEIRDPRGMAVTSLAWNPREGLQLMTASDSGALRLFDLRSSKTTPLAEFLGHTGGVFDISWCTSDPGLVASCAKDNSLILWDAYTGQELQRIEESLAPVAPPPSSFSRFRGGSADAVFAAGGAAASSTTGLGGNSRRYQIDWSPTIRGLLSACSFDRSVSILSMYSVGSKTPRQPSRHPMRAPEWYRRPCGASFGFGSQLVSFRTEVGGVATEGPAQVSIEPVYVTNVGERARRFEASLDNAVRHDQALESPSHEHIVAFCQEQVRRAQTQEEQEIWRFMTVLFTDNTRIELQNFLGYDEATVDRETDYSFLPMEIPIDPNTGQPIPVPLGEDLPENEVDALITRALIVANFRAAVALCLQHGWFLLNLVI